MPSTHSCLHYHIVFSTKERRNLLAEPIRNRLHGYLGAIVANLAGVAVAIGGVGDHVHLLIGLKTTHCVADVVRKIKANSSKWLNEEASWLGSSGGIGGGGEVGVMRFAWQEGYGVFAVSASAVAKVAEYIRDQETHHRKKSFQEEYLGLLRRSGIEFDEKHLW